ncbi:MAG: M20 family metallopeptidase [Spirochaetales bacterium]|nr:M20 family metallopeptidase [Spirochaetales bacterium]
MITDRERELLSTLKKDELIELTRALVRIDSVIRPETGNTEKKVVEFIVNWIKREIGIDPEIDEVDEDRFNIILTIDSGKPGPALLLEGHTDVVSEGERSLWADDPFGAVVKDGRIYGRGSCDMKAGVALNLLIAKALVKSEVEFTGLLKLAILCDEEGMMIGVKDFIKKGHAEGIDACLVSEPLDAEFCLSMKGAIRAVVTVEGKMAHGCQPLLGINPNTRMAMIILTFQEYERQLKQIHGKDEYLGYPSVTFTVVQSPPPGEPQQLNVMPRQSRGWIDIRTIPGQDHDKVKRELEEALESAGLDDPDFNAKIEFIEERPVVSMSADEPIVGICHTAYKDITGKEPTYNGVPGATDGTFLSARAGIPCLVNGPGPRGIPHHVNEYIEIDQLWDVAREYLLASLRYLKAEV